MTRSIRPSIHECPGHYSVEEDYPSSYGANFASRTVAVFTLKQDRDDFIAMVKARVEPLDKSLR